MAQAHVIDIKTRKRKPRDTLLLADGREGKARYETMYWIDARFREPSKHARSGFPFSEDGSIKGVGSLALRGLIAKAQCKDRVTGRIKWTVLRGERVPGTNVYEVRVVRGEA